MSEQNYAININAPIAKRIYNWEKDNDEWFISAEYCSNCHLNISWKRGQMKFCPCCGFMIKEAINPNPPEDKDE